MATKTIKCPKCHGEVEVKDDEENGTPHICPHCGAIVHNTVDPQDVKREEYKPNVYAVLSAVFCMFLPWIIGFPFGIIGDKRALYLDDNTGHKMALVGKVVSVIMMVIYGLIIIITLWMAQPWWGVVALLVIIVVYSIYFGVAYYFTHN